MRGLPRRPSGKGSPLGPDLTDNKWLWSDGSYAGIAKTITDGVIAAERISQPHAAHGRSTAYADQVKALAAYVWALSHH